VERLRTLEERPQYEREVAKAINKHQRRVRTLLGSQVKSC